MAGPSEPGPREVDDGGFVVRPTSVSPRRRPPILGAGAALAVVTLVVVGGFDGLGGEPPSETIPGGPNLALTTDAVAEATRRPRRTPRPAGATSAPSVQPEVMEIELRPAGSNLFVHGDVFDLDVVVVVVSLEDAFGNIGASKAIRLDGGSTAFRLGANDRFSVRFDIADEVLGEGLWVQANAYDIRGMPLVELRRPVPLADIAF